jgi:hypothetical protein
MTDWWEGNKMFDPNFDPLNELQQLRIELAAQKQLINNLINSNNHLSDLVMQIATQQGTLGKEANKINRQVNELWLMYNQLNKPL